MVALILFSQRVSWGSDVKAPSLLYNLVFGESLVNDATSIVLFRTFVSAQMASNAMTCEEMMMSDDVR